MTSETQPLQFTLNLFKKDQDTLAVSGFWVNGEIEIVKQTDGHLVIKLVKENTTLDLHYSLTPTSSK